MSACPSVAVVLRQPAGPGAEYRCVKRGPHSAHRFVLPDESIAVSNDFEINEPDPPIDKTVGIDA